MPSAPRTAAGGRSASRRRGRPPNLSLQRKIAVDVLARDIPDEAGIIQGKWKSKYGARWTSRPRKTVFQEVADKFDVSVRWVEKSFAAQRNYAVRSLSAELADRAGARDFKRKNDSRREGVKQAAEIRRKIEGK